jgi:hypothetical protein
MLTNELNSFNVQLKQDLANALQADVSRIQVTYSLSLLLSVTSSVCVCVCVCVCVYRQG